MTDRARLDRLSAEDLADLIAVAVASNSVDGLQRARIGIAADRVARDLAIRASLESANDLDTQLRIVSDSVRADVEPETKGVLSIMAEIPRARP